jgi:hypothetical protein
VQRSRREKFRVQKLAYPYLLKELRGLGYINSRVVSKERFKKIRLFSSIMSERVQAQVVEVAKNDESKLFAKGRNPRVFYFVHRNGEDFGFFDFVYGNVRHGGKRFNVELEVNGRDATLVVPKQFTDIHRDGLVYVIDTNYPEYIMDPTSIWGINQMYGELTRGFMKVNPFISYPCLATKKNCVGIYQGYSNTFFQMAAWPEGTDERAKFLNDLLDGQHDLSDGQKVHLVVNPARNVHDPVFNALAQQYGRNLERHAVNTKSD